MIEKVQSLRNEMKPDYYGFILVHVKAEQQFKPEGNLGFLSQNKSPELKK